MGLPKLYDPQTHGGLGGRITFAGRLSSPQDWHVTISDAAGAVVARGAGRGVRIAWTWDATLAVSPPYRWTMGAGASLLRLVLLGSLVLHLAFTLTEGRMAPRRREEEYALAHGLLSRGPYARRHWAIGVGLGAVIPAALLCTGVPVAWSLAGAAALVGLAVEEDLLVRAGQALPIS